MKASPVHKDLRSPKYKLQVVKSKKGKGSFKRMKHVSSEN